MYSSVQYIAKLDRLMVGGEEMYHQIFQIKADFVCPKLKFHGQILRLKTHATVLTKTVCYEPYCILCSDSSVHRSELSAKLGIATQLHFIELHVKTLRSKKRLLNFLEIENWDC